MGAVWVRVGCVGEVAIPTQQQYVGQAADS